MTSNLASTENCVVCYNNYDLSILVQPTNKLCACCRQKYVKSLEELARCWFSCPTAEGSAESKYQRQEVLSLGKKSDKNIGESKRVVRDAGKSNKLNIDRTDLQATSNCTQCPVCRLYALSPCDGSDDIGIVNQKTGTGEKIACFRSLSHSTLYNCSNCHVTFSGMSRENKEAYEETDKTNNGAKCTDSKAHNEVNGDDKTDSKAQKEVNGAEEIKSERIEHTCNVMSSVETGHGESTAKDLQDTDVQTLTSHTSAEGVSTIHTGCTDESVKSAENSVLNPMRDRLRLWDAETLRKLEKLKLKIAKDQRGAAKSKGKQNETERQQFGNRNNDQEQDKNIRGADRCLSAEIARNQTPKNIDNWCPTVGEASSLAAIDETQNPIDLTCKSITNLGINDSNTTIFTRKNWNLQDHSGIGNSTVNTVGSSTRNESTVILSDVNRTPELSWNSSIRPIESKVGAMDTQRYEEDHNYVLCNSYSERGCRTAWPTTATVGTADLRSNFFHIYMRKLRLQLLSSISMSSSSLDDVGFYRGNMMPEAKGKISNPSHIGIHAAYTSNSGLSAAKIYSERCPWNVSSNSTCVNIDENIGQTNQPYQKDSRSRRRVSYTCRDCGMPFETKCKLVAHRKLFHVNARAICTVCERAFETNPALQKHMRTHTGEHPFECEMCQLKFTQVGNLRRHERRAHKKYQSKCKVDYTSPDQLASYEKDRR